MGWNTGYKIFEATVVGAYDIGVLNKELLSVLMEPYRDTDIDAGGEKGIKSKDGKGVKQIVIETWGLDMPSKPTPAIEKTNEFAWEDYYESVWDKFHSVTKHFGWL